VGDLKKRSRPPPRFQKKNQPCLGSLAPSGLGRNTVVPLLGTGVACTFPFPAPSGPPSFGPQGSFIFFFVRREKTATLMAEQQGRDSLFFRIGTPLIFLWPIPSSFFSVLVLFRLVFLGDQSSAVGPTRRTLSLVDGAGVRPSTCL